MKHFVINLAVAMSFVSFVAAQDAVALSLKEGLASEGRLVSMEQNSEPNFIIEGFDYTKEFEIAITAKDETPVNMRLWMAQHEGQSYAPYISIAYNGPDEANTASAFIYLYGFIGQQCMGMDPDTVNDSLDFSASMLQDLSEEFKADTRQYGDAIYVTATANQEDEDTINLIVDMANVGEVGSEAWPMYCKFE